ncbi:hypothetical protein E2562_004662 [Oryza meyeriana var. granulata]|uniref:Uncharacterized protein n=1 Tax=Oryza meyeriana var. granulata TaxID=110450 RepID=A0A6G1DDZ0_9ORYZ|nr:hypothetical protein E2562_004662 [Oryza meyeriana var. granulata]
MAARKHCATAAVQKRLTHTTTLCPADLISSGNSDLLERLQVLAFMAFLQHAVAKSLREDDAGEGSQDAISS